MRLFTDRNYSPPPWKVSREVDGTYIRGNDGRLIARMEAGSQVIRNADAALVVQAHNLLKELVWFVDALEVEAPIYKAHIERARGLMRRATSE